MTFKIALNGATHHLTKTYPIPPPGGADIFFRHVPAVETEEQCMFTNKRRIRRKQETPCKFRVHGKRPEVSVPCVVYRRQSVVCAEMCGIDASEFDLVIIIIITCNV